MAAPLRNDDSLFWYPTIRLGLGPPGTFWDSLRRGGTLERRWLAQMLDPRAGFTYDRRRPLDTDVSVYDIGSDFRSDPRSIQIQYPIENPNQYLNSLLGTIQTNREKNQRARIVHIGLKNDDHFDRYVFEALAAALCLEEEFLLDHFLPSLPSDKAVTFEDREVTWAAPVPSHHRYFRLKDCEGRNISAAFLMDYNDAARTVVILSPIKSAEDEMYHWNLLYLGNRPTSEPAPPIFNGSEYLYTITHMVSKEYAHYLHTLSLETPAVDDIDSYEMKLITAQQRLEYCLHNVNVLGDIGNPTTAKLKSNFRYLLDETGKLRQRTKELRERHTASLLQNMAEENLAASQASNKEALANRRLGENAWSLTILAFIFVPVNLASSIFAMHLSVMNFSDGLPIWPFFATAAVLEVGALLIYGLVSGTVMKVLQWCWQR